MLPFKYPRTSQPQGAAIDWSNPLSKDLVAAFNFADGLSDAVSGRLAVNMGVVASVGPRGRGITCISAGINVPWDIGVQTEDLSITIIEHRTATPLVYWMAADNRAEGSGYIYGYAEGLVNPSGTLTAPGYKVTTYCKSEFYQNKVKTNAAIGTGLSPRANMRLFGRYTDSDPYVNSVIYACFIHKRNISAKEHDSLVDSPWQLFKTQARSLWIPGTMSGGSSHTLTGANSTQSSTSGTGAVSQSHLLTGASCSQSATSGTGAITQGATHILTGANSTQAALSGTGAIAQTHMLSGAGSSQTAVSGTGAIIAGVVHILAAADAAQSATSSAAAITQGHVLISAPSVQDSVAWASAIVQRHMLAAAACSQTAVSGVGAITSTAPGAAVYPLASQVLAGVQYGPSGADYVGTLTGGSGPSAADIAAAVWGAQDSLSLFKFLALK